jgi:hypothetical protein
MAPPSLVDADAILELSEDLRRVVRLLPSEDPLLPPDGKKNAASFLFEMRVLFTLLVALRSMGWTIEVKRRAGAIVFVRAPALKATGSYFHLRKADQEWHLTQGTKVVDLHGEERAPDIALEHPTSGDDPTFRHVAAIWDAKLRGTAWREDAHRISDQEFARFALVRKWLSAPVPGKDPLESWPAAFQVCGLITNGQRPSEPASVFLEAAVSVVEHFPEATDACWPSRADHVAYQGRSSRPDRRVLVAK